MTEATKSVTTPAGAPGNPWLAGIFWLGGVLAFIGLAMMIAGDKGYSSWRDFAPAQITGLALLVIGLLSFVAGSTVGAIGWYLNRMQRVPNA